MAAFLCPYCGHTLLPLADSDPAEFGGAEGPEFGESCPRCGGTLQIAYRYRLCEHHGPISGGELYRAVDDGFGKAFAVLFVAEPEDPAAVRRFVDGNRLFADLRGCGLVKIHEASSTRDRRAYVVIDWLDGGTLDKLVARRGAGLEQGVLLQLISDLLTGLSKAHRSMPAVVHGHIHPGKIGFREANQAVLFGFEWATPVQRTSQLADTFTTQDADELRTIASDLRQLGAVVYYAATGEWIGELTLPQQRARARAQVPGPLGQLLDRLLGAGVGGYRSAVDAAMDFEQLMRGTDRWQAPSVENLDRSEERMGTAWTAERGGGLEPKDYYEADEVDEYEVVDDDDVWPIPDPAQQPRSRTPSRSPNSPDLAAWAAERQAQARAEALDQAQAQISAATTGKSGRLVGFAIAGMVMFGTCVAGILEDREPDYIPPPTFEPAVRVEPIPEPYREPMPPPERVDEFPTEEPPNEESPPAATGLAGTFVYTGTISGPTRFAGLALGETCEIWIEPNLPNTGSNLNCRWYVDCGQPRRRIYGGGTAGYSTCTVDADGRVLSAQDDHDDAPDGAFIADFESDEAMLVVLDRWTLPPVHVLISVDEGRLSDARIPKVAQAPRMPESIIADRIAADDYPIVEPGLLAEDW